MKSFYKSFLFFLSFSFLTVASFAQWEKEYFKDKDGFFFFIGVHNFSDVHLVWDEVQNTSLKEFSLERSEDGNNFVSVFNHSTSVKLIDLMGLSKNETDKIVSNPYNQLLFTTEIGTGRYIYNQLIPDFMVNNKKYQWHYRIKFSWADGTTTYSGERSFDFFWQYRKLVDKPADHNHAESVSHNHSEDHAKEVTLQEDDGINPYQPTTLKTDNIPTPLAPCPPVTSPPPGACSTGTTQNLTGTCCTYTQTLYEYPSVNCMGTCCCNIDCSPSSYDSCCVHTCNDHAVCGCTPWLCCGGSNQWVVTQSAPATPPNVTASSTSSPCASNNSATANVSGGSPAYTFLWSPGGYTSSTITNVPPGNYTVTVTDANGCTDVATVTISSGVNSPTVTATSSSTPCTINNSTTASVSGGSPSYTFQWSPGGYTSSTITNVPPGNYTITVTDANGCTSIATVTINNGSTPPTVAASSTYTPCVVGNSATATPSGGSPAYTYLWVPGNYTSSSITNVPPGNYTVTVTDALGCTGIDTVNVNAGNPTPTAIFNSTNVCLGQPITFTDLSTISTGSITGWNWNFGDGNTSTQQNPVHTYTASGNYTVTLTVASNNGCTATITNVVTVYPQPVANFSATSVCINNPTQFTDLSTGGGTSWSWNFGDGNTSTQQNPSNTYASAGNYTVTLTVTGPGGCTSTFSLPVTVYAQAQANFSASTVCVNTPSTQFTDLSGGAATWSWNFGDPASGGNNTSSLQNPSHNYSVAGTYSVTLIVASGNGCADTITQIITVNPMPSAAFSVSTVCFNNATVFTDLSGGNPISWSWSFPNAVPSSSVSQNPAPTYNAAGSYTATLIITDANGCKDTISMPVTVNPLPLANFSSTTVCFGNQTCFTDLTTISSGNITGWSWNFGDPSCPNNISNVQHPCHTYCAPGIYTVILTSTSNNGCTSTVNFQVTVNALPVAAFTASNVCLNALTVFSNTSTNAVQWDWSFGDGFTDNVQNPSHTYLGYGTYIVTLIVSSGAGCKDTLTDTVTVYALPVVNFAADSVCVGEVTSFTDLSFISTGSITSWSWNFGDPASGTNNTSALQNPTHVFTAPGNFNVTLTTTSNYGCISFTTIQVIVYALPVADFSFSPASPLGLTDVANFTDLSTGGVVQWYWLFGDDSTSMIQNPSHLYGDTGIYIIMLAVISDHGCVDTIEYPIEILDYTFFIPTAFTPNDDGTNEFFFGVGIGIVNYEMWIFDRWGNRIFYCKVDDLPQSQPCRWDGKVDGGFSEAIVQQDVYVWKVHLTNVFDKEFDYVGTVTVVK